MPLFDIYISPDEPVYVISVVSKLVEIPLWTLRQLDCVSSATSGHRGFFFSL